jgi:hypothetical protein
MTSTTAAKIDYTYHNAVKNKQDDSQAGLRMMKGAVVIPSDILPLIQVVASAKIENESTGRVSYVYTAEAHAFTLNRVDYWRASITLATDNPDAEYLNWKNASMSRAHDNREAPDRARDVVMNELRRAIDEVRQQDNHAARLRHDAYRDQISRYREDMAERARRIANLETLAQAELDAR